MKFHGDYELPPTGDGFLVTSAKTFAGRSHLDLVAWNG